MSRLLHLELRRDDDVVLARKRIRQLADALGFDALTQTRLATAASELIRNAYRYAGGGTVECWVTHEKTGQLFHIHVDDDGPGIPHLATVLGGQYRSTTGLGLGIVGARRLSDEFFIDAPPGTGTSVEIGKYLPASAPVFGDAEAKQFEMMLARERDTDPYAEVQQQNQELLQVLDELRKRQRENEGLNTALAERGAQLLDEARVAEKARQEAADANRAKSDFLAMMSHELRTPLGAILGYTRLLEMGIGGPVTDEQLSYLQRITTAQAHLLGLINDVLAFAKLDSGTLPIEREPVALQEVVAATLALVEPQLAARSLSYVVEPIPSDLVAFADRGKLLQVLVNLVTNALKFTEPGGTITMGMCEVGESICLTVRDTGRGIPTERLEAIFEPFVQVERRLRGASDGVGLGLAISRELAQAMGGDIHVASVLGEGSTFTVLLPRS